MPSERADLNLFRTFDAIMAHGSLAAAARELGLTASAVSHALARLRALLGDELFLPSAGGVAPTPRAKEIAPGIREALTALQAATETSGFDPARSQRAFRIGASDALGMIVLPPLLCLLGQAAPGVRLRMVPTGRLDIVQQLDEARLDMALGWYGTMPPRIHRRTLYIEHESMAVRQGHPLTEGRVTVKRLLSFRHLVVELTGTDERLLGGFYDDRGVLRRVWMERLLGDQPSSDVSAQRIAATVPGYGAIGPVLRQTDLVATMPLRVARLVADRESLAVLALPYEPLAVPVEMAWHVRAEADRGVLWLAEQLVQVTAGYAAEDFSSSAVQPSPE
jgi:DNA-binding transcriptional LysR family regulator